MDKENAAGVLVDDVPDDVVEDLCFTNLGCGHKDDMADLRIGESVHDGPEIGGPVGAPQTRLGAGFGGKVPFALRPFGNGQIFWGLHSGQSPGDGFHQPAGRLVGRCFSLPSLSPVTHRPLLHALPASPSAPGRAQHTSSGRRCRRTIPPSPNRPLA